MQIQIPILAVGISQGYDIALADMLLLLIHTIVNAEIKLAVEQMREYFKQCMIKFYRIPCRGK